MNLDFVRAVLNDPFLFGLSLLDFMLIFLSVWLFFAIICILLSFFVRDDDKE